MTRRRGGELYPPSGHPPPTEAELGAHTLPLLTLAKEICRRYREEFPDEQVRYGDAGIAWCVHDNQHLLNWGALAAQGNIDMNIEVDWLAGVLGARDFPLDRLARNLDIGANVIAEQVGGKHGRLLSTVLADAATFVRARHVGAS